MALSPQQLADRQNWIGSSDAKVISECNYEQWERLIAIKKGDIVETFPWDKQTLMNAGNHMEAFILDCFKEKANVMLNAFNFGKTVVHNARTPLHSTFDALTTDKIAVEAKFHTGTMSVDELIDYYAPQLQHHMFVTGKDYCWFAVFFGFRGRFNYRLVKRDDDWLKDYVENCRRFWHWYKNGVKPKDFVTMTPVIWDDMMVMNMAELEQFDSTMQSEMNLNAQTILDAKHSNEISEKAKKEIRLYMPSNCRKMYLELTGNHKKGSQLVMTRTKTSNLMISIKTTKEVEHEEINKAS
tara:strand:+ start:2596 stop:3486 length:891 start_codon:yes stop_codon:yes gene_type:complete